MIVVGDVAARKSSKHNGRLILKSFSPFSPYRLLTKFFLLKMNQFNLVLPDIP